MTIVTTRIRVAEDGTISGRISGQVPPGEHEATIVVSSARAPRKARKGFNVRRLPTLDLGPWPEGISLRREDIYGNDGR